MTKPADGLTILAALGLGVAHALSFAPTGAWWAHLVVLALFAALLRTSRRAAAIGYAFGIGWFVAGVGWLYISMHVYGLMPAVLAALAVLLFAAYLSIFAAVAAWACARLARASPLRFAIGFASALTLAEFARGYWFTGFPWLAIGYPHVDGPLSGLAPLLGVYGVGWFAALVAALAGAMLHDAFRGERRREDRSDARGRTDSKRSGVLLPGAVIVTVLALAGVLNAIDWTRPHGEAIAVRLVQGNVPQAMKFDPARIREAMQGYVEQIEASEQTTPRPALIVLPETAWTQPWLATPPEFAHRIEDFVLRTGSAVAIGMPQVRQDPPRRIVTNSVLLLAPSGNASQVRAQQYDKHHLVPFGEFIPWGFRWFVDLMQIPLGDFDRGALSQAPFEIGDQRIAPNICYEDTYGEELIPSLQGANGATILANVSNIAWFGDSHAIGQHLQIARMRSLELSRWTIRATNTGSTAVIDHRGRVLESLAPFTRNVLDARVEGRTGLTPYAVTGNWPAFALALAGIAAWLRRERAVRAWQPAS